MNPEVDNYFIDGCGRCSLFATPQCKVNTWAKELKLLRTIVNDCGLTEELKWGVPVYSFQKKNVLLIGAFKDNCVLSFLKGALLNDAKNILAFPGENSQSGKVIRFTNAGKIVKLEKTIKAYIYEAIEIEKAGLKVPLKKITEHKIPEELEIKFKKDAKFKAAFQALTPGRQRGYFIHFSQPKQAATRISRIEKCIPKIFAGKGMQD